MPFRTSVIRLKPLPDGATGLQLCETIYPQIVITDIRMPGMDGLQVLEILKKQLPDIEVIVATAFGEMDLAIRALQLDASDFITKPISDDALYLALSRARDRYTSRKQLKDYTDLLEKEKAETSQQLFKTIAFQRNLIENSMDGILGCDETDLVVTYNQSMEQILGYPKIEVIHKMTFDRFFSAEQATRFKEELSAEKFGGQNRLNLYETTLRNKSGLDVPVQVSAVTLFDAGSCKRAGMLFQGPARNPQTGAGNGGSSPHPAPGQNDVSGQTGRQCGSRNQQSIIRNSKLSAPDDSHIEPGHLDPGANRKISGLFGTGGNRNQTVFPDRLQSAQFLTQIFTIFCRCSY